MFLHAFDSQLNPSDHGKYCVQRVPHLVRHDGIDLLQKLFLSHKSLKPDDSRNVIEDENVMRFLM